MSSLSRYRLVTHWVTRAPIERVWDLILHSEHWPRWWQGVEEVRDLTPHIDGVGNVRHYIWRSALRYRVTFDIKLTQLEPMRFLEGAASGEVVGWGRWYLRTVNGAVDVIYDWDVEVANPLWRLLSPIGRPIFRWNHHRLMHLGAVGLARELGYEVNCEADPKVD